ncbi:MAG: hypothetical protein J3Q66DRAFT_388121 [Benniella sp.]|nr:MAG: hypothetical protein J3Q66DRAFT_388121 [Benniella sp.]
MEEHFARHPEKAAQLANALPAVGRDSEGTRSLDHPNSVFLCTCKDLYPDWDHLAMSPQKEDPVVEGMRPAVLSLLAVVFLRHFPFSRSALGQSQGNILRNFTEYREEPTIDDARPPRNESRLYPVLWIPGKMRDTAYDLLVAVGHRMKPGAGLAATTPHMVSAVITSLSKLLFEFYKDLDPAMVSEAISTMRLFVNSSNRETVKSALGFIKVTTISLDVEIVRPHLQEILRHILERLVRRFGYDDIVAFVPEADKKLLVNIKKRRERAKRKKANASEMEMDGEADEEGEETTKRSNKPHAMFGSAYEDALYGSESDLSDDDNDQEEDDMTGKTTQKKSNKEKQAADAWIKEDGDTPLDFLDCTVVSRVTASHPSTQAARKVKDLSSAFKTSDGKIVVEESDSDSDEEKQQPVLGHEQAQDQSQERDSQKPQHAEGEERESAIQTELETTRRLVKAMEATDLSMTETREKLKEESRHRENQERRAAYQQAMESAKSRRRSYGLHANHSILTQSSSSVPFSSATTTTATQLSTGSVGASSGTSPLSLHSSQSSDRQTMRFAKQQPLKKSSSELVATAHAHASAIAANRKRNPIH